MNILSKSITALLLATACSTAPAHDFTATVHGHKLYFNITSESDKTVEVTYNGSIADRKYSAVMGNLEIPGLIRHNNTVYSVTAIGAKSFSNATGLEGVTFPSTLASIGDFAFEGCTALRRIVFPGREVTFGEGVFFRCTSIRDITVGSDWRSIDLSRFRWSDSLVTVAVPAKVTRIQGLKSLRSLQSITVDVNNARFSARDGVLYSKDGKTLYGCPRAYSGPLHVADGTEVITRGALTDCVLITEIYFPATLTSLSFRETSRMAQLVSVVFRSKTPPATAYLRGEAKFLLQLAVTDVKISVPNESKKDYKAALAKEEGEYAETGNSDCTPYVVKAGQMPAANSIIGVKNFAKLDS